MEEKRTIFSYLSQVLIIFGVTVLCMTAFTYVFGDSAREISALYRMGGEGIPLEIIPELFLLSVIVVVLQYLLFTDRLLKKMPVNARIACMVVCILAVVCGFILVFDWFLAHMWQPWVLFLVCFAICFFVSAGISTLKTRIENKKLMEGLENMKKHWEAENEKTD